MDLSTYLKERSELVDGFLKIRIGVGAISGIYLQMKPWLTVPLPAESGSVRFFSWRLPMLSVEKALIFCPLRPPLK